MNYIKCKSLSPQRSSQVRRHGALHSGIPKEMADENVRRGNGIPKAVYTRRVDADP